MNCSPRSAGLGAVAASTNEKGVAFREQFVGEDKNVAITKAGGNIEAISGATITSRSVAQAAGVAVSAVEALG